MTLVSQTDEFRRKLRVETMTKKVISFFRKKWVTPSVTAPGDTNLM